MKKVLIIGAGFLQSFVIRKAKALGYHTLTVDANPDAEGFLYADEHAVINITDEAACLAYAKEKAIDGVLTAATDYGVLTAAYIAERMGLHGISYEAARRIKNKYHVRKCLCEARADDTEVSHEVYDDESCDGVKARVSYPVMVKPCDGSGSRGASRVDRAEDFSEACRYAVSQSLTHRATVEPFIKGIEYGVESFVENGEPRVLAVMQKKMTEPPYYAELGHGLPSGLSEAMETKVKCCVKTAIKALQLTFGSVNMDLLITEAGSVHIVDIGARMGGNLIGSHIVPLGTGVDYMGNMIRAAVGDPTEWPCDEAAVIQPVATRLLALTPGVVAGLPDMEAIARQNGVVIEHHLSDGAAINEYHTNLDGMGYVVATGGTFDDARQRADAALGMIDGAIKRR